MLQRKHLCMLRIEDFIRKIRKFLTSINLIGSKILLRKKSTPFTVHDIKAKLTIKYPEIQLSYSTLHKAIKQKLGFKFKTIPSNPKAKNSEQTKKYRFWFVHFFMSEFQSNYYSKLISFRQHTSFSLNSFNQFLRLMFLLFV